MDLVSVLIFCTHLDILGLHFSRKGPILHICHFFYTGRIFEYQIFTPKNYVKHPKITTITPHKCKICSSSHSIWKILHRTEFFYRGAARGARDKYEVCTTPPLKGQFSKKGCREGRVSLNLLAIAK